MEEEQGSSAIVKLNIGGHKYVTTAGTLTNGGDNFFTRLLSGRFPSAKVGDAYFIDRNGRYFEPILDYLRTGRWALPGHLVQFDASLVLAEAEFYGIKPKPFVNLSNKSIEETMREVKAQRHRAMLAKYAKTVSSVQALISELFIKQLEEGATELDTPLICLLPHDVARSMTESQELWPKFDKTVAKAGVHFSEEEVELDEMEALVRAMLWDFHVNGELSLKVTVHELVHEEHVRTRGQQVTKEIKLSSAAHRDVTHSYGSFPRVSSSRCLLLRFVWAR